MERQQLDEIMKQLDAIAKHTARIQDEVIEIKNNLCGRLSDKRAPPEFFAELPKRPSPTPKLNGHKSPDGER